MPRAKVMSSDDLRRAITRIAHEIVERNHGLHDVVLIGLQTGGVPLAHRLVEALATVEPDMPVPVGSLDVAFYRDDIGLRPVLPEAVTDMPVDINGKTVILVDDVLTTGSTAEACARTLKRAGAARVELVSWARVVRPAQLMR